MPFFVTAALRAARQAAALLCTVTFGTVPMAVAQSFSDQIPGVYIASDGQDLALTITLWDAEDGFSGYAYLGSQRYPVYAEQDGPTLRGGFEVNGALQVFSFVPTTKPNNAWRFVGEPAPVEMRRHMFPSLSGQFDGAFGSFVVRWGAEQLSGVLTLPDTAPVHGSGEQTGLEARFPDLGVTVFYDPVSAAYYLDKSDYFGPVTRGEAAIWVGQSDVADTSDLAQALADAEAGSVIEILPGTYQGPFSVSDAITLRGLGERGDIILTAPVSDTDPVLAWYGDGGALSNLTIEGFAGGIGLVVANAVTASNLDVNSADGGVGVAKILAGDMTLQESTITGGNHAVQIIGSEGRVDIVDNTLSGSAKSILTAKSSPTDSTITIRGNSFADSPANAMRFEEVDTVTVRDNTIRDVRVGLLHSGGVATEFADNRLSNIGAHGLWFETAHSTALSITGNALSEVTEACVLFNNVQFPEAGAELVQNSLSGCGSFGVVVAGAETQASGHGITLSDSQLQGNGSHIALYAPIDLVAEGLLLSGSKNAAIILGPQTGLDLSASAITQSGAQGIVAVGDGVSLVLTDVSLLKSAGSGLVLSGQSTASISSSVIAQHGSNGVELFQGVYVQRFEQVAITENAGAGLLVTGVDFTPGPDAIITENAQGDIIRR